MLSNGHQERNRTVQRYCSDTVGTTMHDNAIAPENFGANDYDDEEGWL